MSLPFPNVPNLPGVPPVPRSPAVSTLDVVTLATDAISNTLGLASQATPQWGIYDSTGTTLLVDADSIIDFQNRNEWDVSTFPVQDGGFASSNKVKVPFECLVRLRKTGQRINTGGFLQNPLIAAAISRSQPLSQAQADYEALKQSNLLQALIGGSNNSGEAARAAFLQQIENLAGSIQLVTIITPEWQYQNCNITRYEVVRRGAGGATSLDVDVYFMQIVQTSTTYQTTGVTTTPANPNGTSNAHDPTALPSQSLGVLQPQTVPPQTQSAITFAYPGN